MMEPGMLSIMYTVIGIIAGGLTVAAVTGNVVMYRQVGVLTEAVTDLTRVMAALSKKVIDDAQEAALSRGGLKAQLDELERQMVDVQNRVGKIKDRGAEAN